MAEATPEIKEEKQESASPSSPAPDSDAPAVVEEDKPAAEKPSESDAAPSSDDKPAAEKPSDPDADDSKPAEAESSDAKPSEPGEAEGSESQPKSETADGEPVEGEEKPKPRRKKKASSDSEGEDEDDDDTPPPPPKSKPPTKAPPPPPPKVYDVPPDTWSSAPVSNRVWEVDEQEEYDAPQEEEIDLSDSPIGNFYDIGAELGRGFYAVVKTVTEKSSKNQFALKIVNKQLAPQFSGAVKSELDILAKFNHDNILRGEKFFESDQYLLVVLELAKGGEVSPLIANSNSYTEATAHHLVKQLAAAVAHIHQQGVIHGDLSPENLLLATPDLGSALKLAGFSGSIIRSGELENQQLIGNAEFQPPEVITNQGFNQSADLWSLGCLIFYLLNGASPFKDSNTMRMNMKIRQAKIEFDETWNSISASAKDLISKLLVVDSKARLSGADVLKHPWLSSSPPSTPLPHVKNNITNH